MKSRGWDELDFVYVTGDAYVDHPSFGSAIIGRLLESRGYRVGMIPQPDWRKKESMTPGASSPLMTNLMVSGTLNQALPVAMPTPASVEPTPVENAPSAP